MGWFDNSVNGAFSLAAGGATYVGLDAVREMALDFNNGKGCVILASVIVAGLTASHLCDKAQSGRPAEPQNPPEEPSSEMHIS